MKVLFGLCLIAVVMSVGEASRTYRSALGTCKPGHCVVKDGYICQCGEDGNYENAKCDHVTECMCTPGKKFDIGEFVCTCPESGVLTPDTCVEKLRRYPARRRAPHAVDVFLKFASSHPQQHPTDCDYYRIIDEIDGMLICEPC